MPHTSRGALCSCTCLLSFGLPPGNDLWTDTELPTDTWHAFTFKHVLVCMLVITNHCQQKSCRDTATCPALLLWIVLV